MLDVELKKWMGYLILLLINVVVYFLSLLGVFNFIYRLNLSITEPIILRIKSGFNKTVAVTNSFVHIGDLTSKNQELSRKILELTEENLELKDNLKRCDDIVLQKKYSKDILQGTVINRFYLEPGRIVVDFGVKPEGISFEGKKVFYKNFLVGLVEKEDKGIAIVKTLYSSDFTLQVYFRDARVTGVFKHSNKKFVVDDVLIKEKVSSKDYVYIPGNICVPKLYLGKISKIKSVLGDAKKSIEVEPFVQVNQLNYVYVCAK